jgi:hypothetical protein
MLPSCRAAVVDVEWFDFERIDAETVYFHVRQ